MICSYTKDTGAPKTIEDSSWSTKTEIILVKTRLAPTKLLPSSPKILSRSSNVPTMNAVAQEPLQDLPVSSGRGTSVKPKTAWVAPTSREDSEYGHDSVSVDTCTYLTNKLKRVTVTDKRPKTSNLEARRNLLCREEQNAYRPRSASRLFGKSRSLEKPPKTQKNEVNNMRTRRVASAKHFAPNRCDCAGAKQIIGSAPSKDSGEGKFLPTIELEKQPAKRPGKVGRQHLLTDSKQDEFENMTVQISKMPEEI